MGGRLRVSLLLGLLADARPWLLFDDGDTKDALDPQFCVLARKPVRLDGTSNGSRGRAGGPFPEDEDYSSVTLGSDATEAECVKKALDAIMSESARKYWEAQFDEDSDS